MRGTQVVAFYNEKVQLEVDGQELFSKLALDPPLHEPSGAVFVVESDFPQVLDERSFIGRVLGDSTDDPEIAVSRDDFVFERPPVTRLVLAIQPLSDDRLATSPRFSRGKSEIERILGEESGYVVRVVGVPGDQIPLHPCCEPVHGRKSKGAPTIGCGRGPCRLHSKIGFAAHSGKLIGSISLGFVSSPGIPDAALSSHPGRFNQFGSTNDSDSDYCRVATVVDRPGHQ